MTRIGRNPRQKRGKKKNRSYESSDEEGGMEIPELEEDTSCRRGNYYDDDESLRTLSPDCREAMHSQAQKMKDKKLSVIVSVHEDNLSDFSDHDDDKSQATLQTGRRSSRITDSKRKKKRDKKRKKN